MTTDTKAQIAQWAPSGVALGVAIYLSTSFLTFKDEVLTGLTELQVQVKRLTSDSSETRKRSTTFVTAEQMQTYVALQLLKSTENK